ncbi:MAG: ABC transporter ATP-binding protein [Parvibaculales bacterium]
MAIDLSLDKVSLLYEGAGAHRALHNASAAFPAGSFTALVGPSGCGKSSLLRLLAGLVPPTDGTVQTGAQNDIGFVFQEPALMGWKTVFDNIAVPLRISGLSADETKLRVNEALQLVGLADRASALPGELSGGMKMRVSLARALAKRPPVLLMDEPFAALDELTRFRLDDDLRRIWQQTGCTIIFVTHSVTEAAYLAERAYVMQVGRIAAEVTIDQSARAKSDGFRSSAAFQNACAALSEALGHKIYHGVSA